MSRCVFFSNFGARDVRNGQVQKALVLRRLLEQRLPSRFAAVDLSRRRSGILRLLAAYGPSDAVCVSLGQNGIRAFAAAHAVASRLFWKGPGPAVIYFVVGGWLPQAAARHGMLLSFLRRLQGVYVETEGLVHELALLGVSARVFPNFRHAAALPAKDLAGEGLKLCFCGRIRRDKGPLLAIDLAARLRDAGHRVDLDFYGVVEPEISAEFVSRLGNGIRHLGSYGSEEEAIATMRRYDFLVLPTSYPGECMPGAVVESFFAGTPVIVTDWRHLGEIVDDGVDGMVVPLYGFADRAASRLLDILRSGDYRAMSVASLRKAAERFSLAAAEAVLDEVPQLSR